MKKTTYAVVTAANMKIVAKGFASWDAAYEWALLHDYGQYAAAGGLHVIRR